ncbi:hypothetical protein M885DRAFT_537146 [Pelagophyceae sp. CCMP2097]|nr:hypothetical protein M885DRAFT_537146 [Pelagophyceae sp. CCMP2097]
MARSKWPPGESTRASREWRSHSPSRMRRRWPLSRALERASSIRSLLDGPFYTAPSTRPLLNGAFMAPCENATRKCHSNRRLWTHRGHSKPCSTVPFQRPLFQRPLLNGPFSTAPSQRSLFNGPLSTVPFQRSLFNGPFSKTPLHGQSHRLAQVRRAARRLVGKNAGHRRRRLGSGLCRIRRGISSKSR